MASSDAELVSEVRSYTGYTSSNIFSDSEIQEVVDVAKEEIRSWLNEPSLTFYQTGSQSTFHADRALFWFSCIGLKARAGEIGSIDLTIEDLETRDNQQEYSFWFDMFQRRLKSAEAHYQGSGIATIQLTRADDRSYSYE